jgi:hypothetical protein
VIRRGDGDGVDALVLEHFAQIGEAGRPLLTHLLDLVEPLIADRVVDIDQRGDFDVAHTEHTRECANGLGRARRRWRRG